LLAYIVGVVLFALGIGIAVAIHEAGHMLTAKAFGMKVRRYFIGFGPKMFSFRRGETEYGMKVIPLGGFCDIAGMTALDEVTAEEDSNAMWRYPTWKRFVVLVSGSITHFILGFITLYFMAVSMGLPNIANTAVVTSVSNCAQTIQDAKTMTYAPCGPDSPAPAKNAGIKAGDVIESVAGKATATWDDAEAAVQQQHGPTKFVVKRDGQDVTLTVNVATVNGVPAAQQGSQAASVKPVGTIGILHSGYLTYSALGALGGATEFTGEMFANIGTSITQLPSRIPNLISAIGGAPRSADTPMSVVGASRLGGQAVQDGYYQLFWLLLATLQFFLGAFNLLPLLPLDGGHIAVAFYERVRNWIRNLRGRPNGAPVDYTKLAPLTLVVVVLGGAMVLLTVTADIVNPIRLGGN
jgi:membrane-associated protease RseP (regulator of RpoE activity)